MFNEKVYLTGVDAKNGISVQKELTIGQARSLNTLEIAGFVKKGTSTIVKELPAGFKAGEYYMAFQALDQNGNLYPASETSKNDVTFVSDNPLLIEKVSEDITQLVIGGVDYSAVVVTPGMNVDKGGEVNITAIAKKTGKQTVKNIVVGNVAILDSFVMLSPSGIVAEGEEVEIPFTAKAGDKTITNFTTLARKAGINELKLNKPSDGNLILKENNDGTAKLVYSPEAPSYAWTKSETTDGLDRPVSLTTVVVGGNASNIMLNIADKARPVGIKSVDFDNTLVEKGSTTITLSNNEDTNDFTFVDQYGRQMDRVLAYNFFDSAEKDDFKSGTELKDYKYSIKATYKGEDGVFKVGATNVKNKDAFEIKVASGKNTLTLNTVDTDITGTAKSNMSLDFEIIRYEKGQTVDFTKASFDYTPVSSKKNLALTVVDITSVKNFEVKEIAKLFVQTNNSNLPTGKDKTLTQGMTNSNAGALTTPAQKEVKVTGDYNGKAVTIPADYLTLESNQVNIDGGKITNVKDYVAAEEAKVAEAGIAQVETATVVLDTAAAGDITVVITANGMTNSPKTITVPVLLTDADANAIATKIRAALSADTDVKAFFNVGGTGAAVVLTAKTAAANDTTMNISLTDTGTILTDAITSADTTAGKAPVLATEATPKIGFVWGDFYDATTANFLRKDAKATVKATIKDSASAVINTASRNVILSDAAPVAATIKGPETLTVKPNTTNIIVNDIKAAANLIVTGAYKALDQYGEDFTADINYKAVNVEENKDGYVLNNFKITKNDTKDLDIKGAERGDTFTLELRAGNAKLTVKATVGADTQANITNGINNYLTTLIGNESGSGLESQRLNSLK